jgi:hypothetical protein
MTVTEPKTYRIYFNAHEEAPLVWSVDEGSLDTERKVTKVNVMVTSHTVHTEGEEPRAFLVARGRLVISDKGEAYIFSHDWAS